MESGGFANAVHVQRAYLLFLNRDPTKQTVVKTKGNIFHPGICLTELMLAACGVQISCHILITAADR